MTGSATTLEEVLRSDMPWAEKRRALVEFPYKVPQRSDLIAQGLDWDLPGDDTYSALSMSVDRGLLTREEYREVVEEIRARSTA